MPALYSPSQNHLLAALPQADLKALSARLELVPMPLSRILYDPGEQLRHAYFPTTCIVSLQCVTATGASAETAGVGNEGVVGVALFMGGDTMPSSAMVQAAGHAYRLERHLLKQEFDRAGSLQHLLLRYTQALMTQLSQTAACNSYHLIEQQLCRWLLLTQDRVCMRELTMTQQSVASLLGVRREGVTKAAGKLQRAGFISCRRGHIVVLDRLGLESRACECYGVIKEELDQLLSDVGYPADRGLYANAASVKCSENQFVGSECLH